jgi:hypothetical protein
MHLGKHTVKESTLLSSPLSYITGRILLRLRTYISIACIQTIPKNPASSEPYFDTGHNYSHSLYFWQSYAIYSPLRLDKKSIPHTHTVHAKMFL